MGLLHDRFFREFPGVSRTREFIRHVKPFALGSCQLLSGSLSSVESICTISPDLSHLLTRALAQESNCFGVFAYLRNLYNLPKRQAITCDGQDKAADGVL
ncbi:hypothetical protein PC128_g872 [Phytophthora cactorum]|nr:hypothetical protein PC128_g872 [Phytophthora cactorum]